MPELVREPGFEDFCAAIAGDRRKSALIKSSAREEPKPTLMRNVNDSLDTTSLLWADTPSN